MSTADAVVEADPPEQAASYEVSIGDVMTTNYVAVTETTTVGEALRQFQETVPAAEDRKTVYYVYVVDAQQHLVGVLSVRKLLSTPDETEVKEVMDKAVASVDRTAAAADVAGLLVEMGLSAVPIVDDTRKPVGIVRAEALIEVTETESSDDMLRMQGLNLPSGKVGDLRSTEQDRSRLMLDASLVEILRIRVPWLIVALAGGFLAGGVIGVYEAALDAVVVLAFFIPVVMDMGGNVGTQSSTIFIRGVVLGHIDRENVVRRIGKETVIGAVIGVLVGAVAAGVAYAWLALLRNDPAALEVAGVVFGAMVGTSVVAALVGFLIPWLVYWIGQDPAAASNPVVTTIKDVTGLLIYFGLAAVLLSETVL